MSQVLDKTVASCVSFWYDMYGTEMGNLNVYTKPVGTNGILNKVYTLSGDQGPGWKQSYVGLQSQTAFMVVIEGTVGPGIHGDLAIDDLSISIGDCPTITPPPTFKCGNGVTLSYDRVCDFNKDCANGTDEANCGSCTFDNGDNLCGNTDVSQGSFQWVKDNYGTPTNNTGPTVDHTTGTPAGFYMYVGANKGKIDDQAGLQTPVLHQAAATCQFTFWYHMHGYGIGSLTVSSIVGQIKSKVWTISGNQGLQWKQAVIDIGRIPGPFSLQIQASRSYSVVGDIAVDDFNFTNCALPVPQTSCSGTQYHCGNNACVDKTQLCDFTDDCGDGSDEMTSVCSGAMQCEFSSSICFWLQDSNDQFDWLRQSGNTGTSNTGPTRDHTTGLNTGYYVFIETSSPRRRGDKARLVSPIFQPTTAASKCQFTFYYNMYGATIGALNVFVRLQNLTIISAWSKTGGQTNVWSRQSLNLIYSQPFEVIIEGVKGTSYTGDIGIDDTTFSSGCQSSTNTLPPNFTMPPSHATTVNPNCNGYQCPGAQCITQDQVCDFKLDCADGSDEVNCGACDFENGNCNWRDISSGQYQWDQSVADGQRGPSSDHTLGANTGHYSYLRGSTGVFANKGVLSSPVLPAASANCEMHFYYNIFGAMPITLQVTTFVNGVVTPIWVSQSITGHNQWSEGTAYIGQRAGSLPKGSYVRFEAQPFGAFSPSSTNTVAVDDITFNNCNPYQRLPTVTCNFDADFCSWTNVGNTDKFDWTRMTGSTNSTGTGPASDHTSGQGSYIFIETSAPRAVGDTAQLLSPRLPPTSTNGNCLTFWYNMFGPHIGNLNLFLLSGGNKTLFWSKTGPQGDKWQAARRTISSNIDYQLIIEGVTGNGYQGDIAIDDVSLTNSSCPPDLACDFQDDFCGWTQSHKDNFDWIRAKGGTSSRGTGPRYDHTFNSNSGYYAYIETSSPRKAGDRAILVSPTYTSTSPQCLRFWYHMFGQTIGRLVIHQRDYGSSTVQELWMRSGDHGDIWRQGHVTAQSHGSNPFTLEIVGYRGNSDSGDLAIDDVELLSGPCQPQGFCDFETDACQWVNTQSGDDFDWQRDKGATPSNKTGPSFDHTLSTEQGHYMFIEASGLNRRTGEKAYLFSDYQDPNTAACLSFWYHMYGDGIGSLNVYTKIIQTGNKQQRFTLSGNQGNQWQQASVDIPTNAQHILIIEGVRGTTYLGDIAIDDVRITRTTCANQPPLFTAPATGPSTTPFPATSLDCDFELGLCQWAQDTNDDFDWISNTGSTLSGHTGPSTDHTIKDLSGHYMFIEVSARKPNTKARLVSVPLDWSYGRCFKFWYNMYGAHVNALNIYKHQFSIDTLIWQRTGNLGVGWKYGQVYINQPGSTSIVIEGLAGQNYTGDIAIDDLSSNAGLCPATNVCDFEDSLAGTGYLCGYSQDSMDDFDWSLHSGTTGTTSTGPVYDHTYSTRRGHYVFIESSSPQHSGDKARLISPVYQPSVTGSTCVTFWYSMNGRDIGTLNVFPIVANQQGRSVWSLGGNQGNQWLRAQATITSSFPYQVAFEGVVGAGFKGDVAMDDISIADGACAALGSCNFEQDLCDWTNSNSGDNFDWERAQGATVTTGTGPGIDHTLKTAHGTYLYIESSAPRVIGDKAWLVSGTFSNGSSPCLSFWYNMNGNGMGSLRVNIWPFNTGLSQSPLWTKSGNQGTQWYQDQVQIIDPGVDYRVVFEAVRGTNINSDVAIDDISMLKGDCLGHQITTVNPCVYNCDGHCITSDKICDLKNDCVNGRDEFNCGYNCNFENSTCKWVTSNDTSYTWNAGQGASPVANAGPPIDHTLLSPFGHYMYLGVSAGVSSLEGRYVSPVLRQASATCTMEFYYHMFGTNVGHIYVYVQNDYQETRVLRLRGDQGNSWQRGFVSIGRQTNPFRLIISARRSFSTKGDIAIDDISFSNCGYPATQPTCAGNQKQFQCNNSVCIRYRRVCDLTDDCGDNSDEDIGLCRNIMACTFEDSTCFWKQDKGDDFDWQRHLGPTSSAGTGPMRDHTTNSINGHFMFIEASSPRVQGDKARFLSPFLKTDHDPSDFCMLRMYYYMYGNDIGSLTVNYRLEVDGDLHPFWGISGSKGDYYHREEINIFNAKPIQIVIEATVGNGSLGDIGIDDISFSSSCQLFTGAISTDVMPHTTTPNPCGLGKRQCANGQQCVPISKVCDFYTFCSDGSDELNCGQCDFETGLCGWMDMSAGSYAWERHNGSTTGAVSGPSVDHTTGEAIGTYVFIDSTRGGTVASNAELVSPIYGALGASCEVRFAFHKKGDSQGYMRLYLVPPHVDPAGTVGRIVLWSAGTVSDNWQLVTVGIGARDPGYSLVFEAVKHLHSGDMAIDDVNFFNCQVASHTGDCAPNQFTCVNDACIDIDRKCDFANDCGDNSDEIACLDYVERCDFETDICNWIQDDTDDFNWAYTSGGTSTIGTGPRLDHTLGTSAGHYVYIETSSPQHYNDKARLKSPVFQVSASGNCRMRMFYHMHDVHINALHIYKENFEFGPMEVLANITGNQDDEWLRLDTPLISPTPFRVIIEAVVGHGFKGDIAIDDISFTLDCKVMPAEVTLPAIRTTPSSCGAGKLPCNNGQCIPSQNFCNFRPDCSDSSDESKCPSTYNFENGTLRLWKNDPNNDFNWTVASNGNPDAITGPSVDHTQQISSGKYLLLKGLINSLDQKVARIISPIYNQAGKTCNFTFWYNAHGKEFPNINVYIRKGGRESKLTSVYGTDMTTGQDTWKPAVASLPLCASSFQIILESTSLGAFGIPPGFLAVDDFVFMNCEYPPPQTPSCAVNQFTCDSGHCIDITQKCDYQTDCCDGSDEKASTCAAYNMCDFEYGLCDWAQVTSDNFDWKRNRGPTSSYGTGPSQDHTTASASGFYLFIESKQPRQVGDYARIAITLPKPRANCGLKFWYNMYGTGIGSLNVYTMSINNGLQLVSNVSGDQGQQWKQFNTLIPATSSVQVIIQGVIGTDYHGDIAIDDISLTPECGAPSTPAPTFTYPTVSNLPHSTPKGCPAGQYTCGTGQCIPATKACDGVNDCADNSDEARCLTACDFEQDQCGWSEVILDGFDFMRSNGAKAASAGLSSYAPSTDHTRGDQNGYFMYALDTTDGRTVGKTAMLTSPILYSARPHCKIQFAYYMKGQDVGQLIFKIQEAGSAPKVLWRRIGTLGVPAAWKVITIGLGKHTGSFVVTIQKIAGTYNGQSAIDDISYIDCDPQVAKTQCLAGQFTCSNHVCVGTDKVCDMSDDCGDGSDESNCAQYLQTNYEVGLGQYFKQGVDGTDDDFGWMLAPSYRNESVYPGPPFDHTREDMVGKYLYIDSNMHERNSKAWLMTNTFQPTTNKNCTLIFYLYIYGQNPNTFTVYNRFYNSGPPTTTLYRTEGEEGPYWQKVTVTINSDQPFQVLLY